MKNYLFIFVFLLSTISVHGIDRNNLLKLKRVEARTITNLRVDSVAIPKSKIKPVLFENFKRVRQFNDQKINQSITSKFDVLPNEGLFFDSEMNEDSINYFREEAFKTYNKIEEDNRFIDYLTLGQSFQLPVGIKKTIGGLSYTVMFTKVRLTENNAYIDAFLTIKLPSDKILAFMGRGIEFSASGGITGTGRVELLGNNNIDFDSDPDNNKVLLTLFGGDALKPGNTYAEFDCYGFKELSIDAGITFSRDFLKLENPDGTLSNDRVTSRFTTKVSSWNDIVVDLSLPRFQLASLKGWSFEVSNAIFDFSDNQNASGIVFPADYDSPYFNNGLQSLWRGFYFREVNVFLPNEFNKKGSDQRTSFYAYDLIIDELGFTGVIGAKNILDLNDGNADSWKLSVNDINVEFYKSEFISGNLSGEIEVPSLETDEPLAYSGTFNVNGNYDLIARLQSTAKFNVFQADLNLEPNSLIELKGIEGKFKPRAVLHGSMNLKPTTSSGKKVAEVNGLVFQSLVLQTEAPYLDAQYFGFENNSDGNTVGGFSIGIEKVALEIDSENRRVGIQTELTVNLVKAADNGFGAKSAFTIWANQNQIEERITYEYDRLELDGIAIKVDRPGFSFDGSLVFYEGDNTYGNGFKGSVLAEFGSDDSPITVQATALFGSVDGFRYWYVDAMAEWPNGLPVVAPFAINGLGGGAFYHMRQQGLNENIGSQLGRSVSNIIYIPDDNVHLGIKASVTFSIQNAESTANGKAEFGIAFNSKGGINQIAFNGSVEMMTGQFNTGPDVIKDLASKVSNQEAITSEPGSAFRGDVRLLFDNVNNSFHGVIDVYVNAAGGVVTGSNPGYLAGRSIIHFEENYWYIHIGKPTNPIGIQFLGLAKADTYFMIGHEIPPLPPPPPEIWRILDKDEKAHSETLEAENIDNLALRSGKGFAFGANFTVDTGQKEYLMFYGRFAATAGFDINLSHIQAKCKGEQDIIGINGWYASGQAYFGLWATIGMDIKLKFIDKRVEIFYGALAALMQVEGPNPFWMKGNAAGTFSVLDGLVEGNFDFELEIGEKCEKVSLGDSPLKEMNIIAELTPASGTTEVDVFTSPQAVFNIPVEKEFKVLDFERNPKYYRVKLDYFKLMDGATEMDANISFNSEKNVFVLDPKRILPSESQLDLKVKIHFEEKKNGVWTDYKENGKTVTESMDYTFTSGLQPDYIPKDLVEYSYPIEGMVNFYQNEYNQGYIKLTDAGLTRPFEKEGRWDLKAAFTDKSGNSVRTDFTYNDNTQEVRFDLDPLDNDKIYHFQLLRVPSTENVKVDSNVKQVKTSTKTEMDGKDLTFEVETQEAEGSIEALTEEEIFSLYFRTSKYNTLGEKFFSDDYDKSTGSRFRLRHGVHQLSIDFNAGFERFGDYEINGGANVDPLIYIEADFENNIWYQNHLGPLVYNGYPYFPIGNVEKIRIEENLTYGVPPKTAFYISQPDTDLRVNQSTNFDQTFFKEYKYFAVKYFAADYVEKQYTELRDEATTYYATRSRTARIENFITSVFPIIRKGSYPTNFKYILPGGISGQSNFILYFTSNVGEAE
ncbi:hypothetical protein QYS48_31280 [Marivirga arenosa]|uniref:Uncharacterized protein n=1 Tax=Marivirga arenosa TaxID=3059076 RepID=A0AA51N4B1_9BACT|nr:hypothetical protein [Marivirga sp. ABR2-2]WMN06012.1 hypothetical protein QYS48_31280 [Marivirga sp. ABR2-2]